MTEEECLDSTVFKKKCWF